MIRIKIRTSDQEQVKDYDIRLGSRPGPHLRRRIRIGIRIWTSDYDQDQDLDQVVISGSGLR